MNASDSAEWFSSDEARLPAAPGGWLERRFDWPTRSVRFSQPARPDDLLEDPQVIAALDASNYDMPYWAYLWQAATTLAELVAARSWPPGLPALELGSGLGLVGLAGLTAGLQVTFSDYDPQAVQASLWNARQNGYAAQGVRLDWREPLDRTWPLIFAADVLYEECAHAWLLELLRRMLASPGVCWIGDPGRQRSPRFAAQASAAGFEVEFLNADGVSLPHFRVGEFQAISLRR